MGRGDRRGPRRSEEGEVGVGSEASLGDAGEGLYIEGARAAERTRARRTLHSRWRAEGAIAAQ